MIEKILARHFMGRALKKNPDRAIRQCALEIMRASANIRLTTWDCAALLACSESWVRAHVTRGRPFGGIPMHQLRDFMAEVKAHKLGGTVDDYRYEHNIEGIRDLVLEAFYTADNKDIDQGVVFHAYAQRLLLVCGERFLSRDQVVRMFDCPSRYLIRNRSILTPFDLRMGQNRKPFIRFSFLEATEKRDVLCRPAAIREVVS